MTDLQRTDEWYAARIGKLTASRILDATGRTKGRQTKTKGFIPGKYLAARETYLGHVIAERLTGQPYDAYVSRRMQRGQETEAEARAAYSFYSGNPITLCGFIDHPSIPMAGASPDGMVREDGLVETKCPDSATHAMTLAGEPIADEYVAQMQWQMATTGRAWCDFVSYDPRMPEDLRVFVQRVERDPKHVAELEDEARKFLAEVEAKIEQLERKAA